MEISLKRLYSAMSTLRGDLSSYNGELWDKVTITVDVQQENLQDDVLSSCITFTINTVQNDGKKIVRKIDVFADSEGATDTFVKTETVVLS